HLKHRCRFQPEQSLAVTCQTAGPIPTATTRDDVGQQPLPHRSHRDWCTFPSLLTSLTNGVPIGFLLMILRMQRFGANVSDLFEYLRIRNVFSDFLSFSKRLIDSKPNGIREIFRSFDLLHGVVVRHRDSLLSLI